MLPFARAVVSATETRTSRIEVVEGRAAVTDQLQPRFAEITAALAEMRGGDLGRQLPISPAQDELDAICRSVNILVSDLALAMANLRRAQAAAEAANEAKSAFLRTASHELRTPLAVIVWLAEALRDPSKLSPERLASALASIRRSAQDLMRTTDAVLDMSRLEQPNAEAVLEATDLIATIHEALQNLHPLAAQKKLGLRVALERSAPAVLMTHAQHLRQVVVNLVANAIKFTPRGEIVVRVQGLGDQVAVDVEDPGAGIPPDARARIFEPFFQIDPAVSQRLGGTGLGLALAKRLAERLGGDLSLLASTVGEGSTFRLLLPFNVPSVTDGAAAGGLASNELRSLWGLRILVVDDEDPVREAVSTLLETAGARVLRAVNGQDAMKRALAEELNLVLMDVRMPVVDGLTATRELRAAGFRRPIIALTAGTSSDERAACLAAGCDDQLTKPIAPADLIAKAAACRRRLST